jgi:hypothetical protein
MYDEGMRPGVGAGLLLVGRRLAGGAAAAAAGAGYADLPYLEDGARHAWGSAPTLPIAR